VVFQELNEMGVTASHGRIVISANSVKFFLPFQVNVLPQILPIPLYTPVLKFSLLMRLTD
jgi:hypothetical protein